MGRLPSYFSLWKRTLSKNDSYDFLLVTDQQSPTRDVDNLHTVRMSFDDLRSLFASRLSLPVNIQHPYKLCDFKPAYGEIFGDYLAGYDFWGCCDLDMLLGDLNKFITPDLLGSYKKLFSRGHLTIYRNEPLINAAYRSSRSVDHKQLFTSPDCFLFDEWHGIHRIFEELGIDQYNREVMGDIKVYSSRLVCTNIPNHKHQIFAWSDGKVRQYYLQDGRVANTELAYIHFQKRKIILGDRRVYNSPVMILNPQSILPYEGSITPAVIKKFDRSDYNHYFQSQLKRIKKKVSVPKEGSLSINKKLQDIKP